MMLWTAPRPGTRVPWMWALSKAPTIGGANYADDFDHWADIANQFFRFTAWVSDGLWLSAGSPASLRPDLPRAAALPGWHRGLCFVTPWSRSCKHSATTCGLMPPAYVKPYVKRQKNDMADAEAICEAVTRANMRFVPTKTLSNKVGWCSIARAICSSASRPQ